MSLRSFIKNLSSERWNIGFIENSLQGVIEGEPITVKWMNHSCKNSWFADPFILKADESSIIVLCEEFYKPINLGRISRLCIDRKTMNLVSLDVILELKTHLSFPIIQSENDKVYIYPESGKSGKLTRYLYNDETKSCSVDSVLVNEALADPAILSYDGKEYLFATPSSTSNGNVLRIYDKDPDNYTFSKYVEYPFEERIARMAGAFFTFNGKVYRPTQECNVQYGHAVTLQEVSFNKGKWSFKEVRRLYSVHPILNIGMHTFNVYNNLIVTDALGFERVWIRKILKKIGLLNH